MNLTPLVRNWWMMAIRGLLAMAFVGSLVIWPGLTLSIVVLLFSIYATIDGAWSIAAGMRPSTGFGGVWPVLLEGGVSTALGDSLRSRPVRARRAGRSTAGRLVRVALSMS
jgi:uncharacterized membrane protein HdeD (DUF308 family)